MKKLFVLMALVPLTLNAQKDYRLVLDRYMQAQVKENDFSGAVLVAKNGKVIYKAAFGLANREWNVPNTVESKFRIASITKQFTAAAIMQLVEEGKIKVTDKLTNYFPDFPKGDSVTVHMLLNHTSGIQSYTSLKNFSSYSPLRYAKDSVLALFKDKPYDFSPGTRYRYNNSGYFLLGYIIEKVSGKSYGAYLLENVIKKAGLKSTAVNELDSILAYRVSGYEKKGGRWVNAEYISMEFPYSAGAIVSTVEELFEWQQALSSGKIVSAASFHNMTTPYLNHYGYGLIIDSFQHQRRIGHSGGIPGFQTKLDWYPEAGLTVVVLANCANMFNSADALAAIALDAEVVSPYKHLEAAIDAKLLERYQGKFHRPNSPLIDTFRVEGGKLYVHPQNDSNVYELVAESPTKFFLKVDPENLQFEFEVEKDGKLKRLNAIEGGIKSEMRKL